MPLAIAKCLGALLMLALAFAALATVGVIIYAMVPEARPHAKRLALRGLAGLRS